MLSLIRFSCCNSHLAHILAILNTSAPSGKTILFVSTLHFLSFKQIFIQGKTLLLTLPDLLQRFTWSLLKNQGCVMSPHPHSCTSLQKMMCKKWTDYPQPKVMFALSKQAVFRHTSTSAASLIIFPVWTLVLQICNSLNLTSLLPTGIRFATFWSSEDLVSSQTAYSHNHLLRGAYKTPWSNPRTHFSWCEMGPVTSFCLVESSFLQMPTRSAADGFKLELYRMPWLAWKTRTISCRRSSKHNQLSLCLP